MCTHLYSQAWDSVFVLGYQNIAICVFQQVPMVRENMPNLTCTNVYNKYTLPYFSWILQSDWSDADAWFYIIVHPVNTYTHVSFMTSSNSCQQLDAEQLLCHNADIVTRCLFILLYKHRATCVLLAMQESSKWALSFKRLQGTSICDLAWFCTLLELCYSTQHEEDSNRELFQCHAEKLDFLLSEMLLLWSLSVTV